MKCKHCQELAEALAEAMTDLESRIGHEYDQLKPLPYHLERRRIKELYPVTNGRLLLKRAKAEGW